MRRRRRKSHRLTSRIARTAAGRSDALDPVREQPRDDQRKLDEAELRFRSVVDNVVDGIITIDERAMVESFNPAAEKIFGYRADEVLGRNVNMLMPEPYHGQHDSYVDNYLQTGRAKIIGIGREVQGRRKDGSIFPMDLAVSEFRLKGRRMFAGIVRDISERKRVEQTFKFLAAAGTTLDALVDYQSTLKKVAGLAVPFVADWCMIDLLDPDGSLRRVAIAHADPQKVLAAEEVARRHPPAVDLSFGPAQVLRSRREEIIPKMSDAMLAEMAGDEEHLRYLRSLGLRSVMNVPLEIRSRLFGVMSFASAESGHEYGPSDLALAGDLAHRVAVALENARLYAEVKDADRRKDDFLAMLAHELRNPLAPIRSGLDLLDMEGVDAATSAWARGLMKQQIHHLVRLVDDLLDVSRIMRGKVQLRKERISLADAVQRGIETARPLIELQHHELHVELPLLPVWIEADPVRIAQVVANLLNNAAKYNDKPGHITLTCESHGDQAVLRVRDDGIGIEKELLPRVFGLFTQADRSIGRSQGGLGIGLTLVRSLVEMHDGSVEARSEGPGMGSEFIVRLPVMAAEPEAASPPARPGITSRHNGHGPHHRVLVVDDNAAAAQILSEIAARLHHEVRVAYTGETALEMAGNYLPDIIFLDIGLPGINGYQVAEQLRRQPEFSRTLLVAVTGYGREDDRRRSREAGFNHHLVKPVAPDALYELLSAPAVAI